MLRTSPGVRRHVGSRRSWPRRPRERTGCRGSVRSRWAPRVLGRPPGAVGSRRPCRKDDDGHDADGAGRCDTGRVDHLTGLLVAARDGDRRALDRFVAETQADVWRVSRYLGDVAYADDLAQETYERAIGSIHRFRAEGSGRGWLLTIARRTCVDHTRRAARRRRLDRAVFDDTTAGSLDGTVSPPTCRGASTTTTCWHTSTTTVAAPSC